MSTKRRAQAGGRCRSYHDLTIDMEIDNGNHLLLSGNHAALSYLDVIGARHLLIGPGKASMPFIDLKTNERWTLRANDGLIPWWILNSRRRVPGTSALSYLSLLNLRRASPGARVGDVMNCEGPLYDRLIGPFLLAALNIEPPEGSAALAAAVVSETLLAGGRNYHPLIAHDGLSTAFVDPGLAYIAKHNGTVAFEWQLRGFTFEDDRVAELDFGSTQVRGRPGRCRRARGAALVGRAAGARPCRCRPNSAPSSTRISRSSRRPAFRRSPA